MTLSEKSAYLKGLMDGLNLSKETPEGKMISGIVDLLQDMTSSISDLEENAIAVSDELDEIEDDLDAIEDFIMDDEDDEDDDWDDEDEDWEEYEDDENDEDADEGFDFGDEDSTIYEVTCSCGNVIDFDEETLEKGSIVCPNCGETLELSTED